MVDVGCLVLGVRLSDRCEALDNNGRVRRGLKKSHACGFNCGSSVV